MRALEYDAIDSGYAILSSAAAGGCRGVWCLFQDCGRMIGRCVAGQASPFEAQLGASHFTGGRHVRAIISEEETYSFNPSFI